MDVYVPVAAQTWSPPPSPILDFFSVSGVPSKTFSDPERDAVPGGESC